MPSGAIHSLLTRQVVGRLRASQRERLQPEMEALCGTYCQYPDTYYGKPEEAAPYLCFIDEIPFHYPPHEAVEYNAWRMEGEGDTARLVALPLSENVHHRHCRTAFHFYFEKIAASWRDGRINEAARFIGALCHVLQDNTLPVHALEGFDGIDIFALDRLMVPPTDRPFLVPSLLLGQLQPLDPGDSGHVPCLLGTSPAEAAFHGYTRFAGATAANRLLILPLVSALYAGDTVESDRLWRRMGRGTVDLLADFLHTALAGGTGEFPADEKQKLERVPLESVRPARRPRFLSAPYRFTPFLLGKSLDCDRNPVGLALHYQGEYREYSHGLGFGGHAFFAFEYDLPPGVFRRLTGLLGLHATLGRRGRVRMRWKHDGHTVWESDFSAANQARAFDLDVSAGGWWILEGEALTSNPLASENQMVLADPLLVRHKSGHYPI